MSIKVIYATWRIDDYCLHCHSTPFIFIQVVTKLSNMTSHEPSETKRNVYDACDPQYLRQLREAAGMDHVVLARTACLSVAQVRQLETDDSDNLFYSDAIKRQAYKRLLMILGAEPPTVEVPQELRDPGKVAEAHLNTLDQIVAMSHQPAISRPASDVFATGLDKVKQHQQFFGALFLLVGAVALFVWNGMQNEAEVSLVPAVEATSTTVVAASAMQASSPTEIVVPALPASASASVAAAVSVASTSTAATANAVSPALAASAVASAVATKLGACAYSNDAMPEITSAYAQKEGRYVYFESASAIQICVVDGNKQATLLQLNAGDKRSVYGVSPWQLSGAGLQKAQIYFQGGRISWPDASGTRFKLIEVPVAR